MLSVQGDFPDGVVLSFWLSDGEAQVGSVRRPAGPGYSSPSTQQELRRASILSGKKQAVARRIRQTQSIRRPGSVVSLEIPQTLHRAAERWQAVKGSFHRCRSRHISHKEVRYVWRNACKSLIELWLGIGSKVSIVCG